MRDGGDGFLCCILYTSLTQLPTFFSFLLRHIFCSARPIFTKNYLWPHKKSPSISPANSKNSVVTLIPKPPRQKSTSHSIKQNHSFQKFNSIKTPNLHKKTLKIPQKNCWNRSKYFLILIYWFKMLQF